MNNSNTEGASMEPRTDASADDCANGGIAGKPELGKLEAAFSDVTILPDGSAFAIASFPLPKDHWLYAERTYDLNKPNYAPDELPDPILTHAVSDTVVAAIRYAVRGATMCGKEEDFDPDALVQNAVYALCGPFGGDAPI